MCIRDSYHSSLVENHFDFYYESIKNGIKVHPYPDSPAIFCKWGNGEFLENRAWYKDFHYDKSAYRGLDANEDSYRIGYVTSKIKAGKSIFIMFTDDEKQTKLKPAAVEKKQRQKYQLMQKDAYNHAFLTDLLLSGEQFIVNRASTSSKTILAGYHWFTDWGRDTMIAMRGLTISTGRKSETESLLNTFFKYLDEGMLPNRFPDYAGQEVEYNTIAVSYTHLTLPTICSV